LSDGIATYWVSRVLAAFYEAYPNIELRMILGSDLTASHNEVFDIRLHYFEPAPCEQIAKPVATVHFLPFASRAYVERHGMPASREDLKHHRVLDSAQYLSSKSSWASWFGPEIEKSISLFTNQSAFLARCVANGAGIALMPSYMTLSEADIVPIEIGLQFKTKLFVTYHRERALKHPVKATLAFLRGAVFNPRHMPWFSDAFIAPAKSWRESFDRALANAGGPGLQLLQTMRG
jgi:DNA-binding transcriptional LysR family regulator